MLFLTSDHSIYEIWSEDAAESVYVDHEPTADEVDQVWREQWPNTKKKPTVFKELRVYTGNKCTKCNSRGRYSTQEGIFKCDKCNGRGWI